MSAREVTLRYRAELGWSRVQQAVIPVAQASAAAAVAFLFARYVLGHENPFFAAFGAWACLGFSANRELRRVAEIGIGVTLGVTMGDIVVRFVGSGWWQIASVLFVAALLARFLDRGAVLTAQAGAQAIVITGIPNLVGGPYGRAIDAITGAIVACVVVMAFPKDPRRALRRQLAAAVHAMAEAISRLAEAARTGHQDAADAALDRARHADAPVRDAVERTEEAFERAGLTVNRRHLDDLANLAHQATLIDQAMRAIRVLARRAASDLGASQAADRLHLAHVLYQFSLGAHELADDIAANQDPINARLALQEAANMLNPAYAEGDLGVQAQLIMLRSAVVDTLEAAGASPVAARAPLPDF